MSADCLQECIVLSIWFDSPLAALLVVSLGAAVPHPLSLLKVDFGGYTGLQTCSTDIPSPSAVYSKWGYAMQLLSYACRGAEGCAEPQRPHLVPGALSGGSHQALRPPPGRMQRGCRLRYSSHYQYRVLEWECAFHEAACKLCAESCLLQHLAAGAGSQLSPTVTCAGYLLRLNSAFACGHRWHVQQFSTSSGLDVSMCHADNVRRNRRTSTTAEAPRNMPAHRGGPLGEIGPASDHGVSCCTPCSSHAWTSRMVQN